MLWPLALMAFAATLLMVALLLGAMRNEILRRRLRTLELGVAAAAANTGTAVPTAVIEATPAR